MLLILVGVRKIPLLSFLLSEISIGLKARESERVFQKTDYDLIVDSFYSISTLG